MSAVAAKWRQRADEFEASGLHDFARLVRTVLQDVEQAPAETPVVPLPEACRRSGYSYKHLWRLVRSWRLTNVGTPTAIRVRLQDLPRKVGRP
jgi:hypothetical protein